MTGTNNVAIGTGAMEMFRERPPAPLRACAHCREIIAAELKAEADAYEREHPGQYPAGVFMEAARLVLRNR